MKKLDKVDKTISRDKFRPKTNTRKSLSSGKVRYSEPWPSKVGDVTASERARRNKTEENHDERAMMSKK